MGDSQKYSQNTFPLNGYIYCSKSRKYSKIKIIKSSTMILIINYSSKLYYQVFYFHHKANLNFVVCKKVEFIVPF